MSLPRIKSNIRRAAAGDIHAGIIIDSEVICGSCTVNNHAAMINKHIVRRSAYIQIAGTEPNIVSGSTSEYIQVAASIDRGARGAAAGDIQITAVIDNGIIRCPSAGDSQSAGFDRVFRYECVFHQESGTGRSSLKICIRSNCQI